jgi:hypothetical protein
VGIAALIAYKKNGSLFDAERAGRFAASEDAIAGRLFLVFPLNT